MASSAEIQILRLPPEWAFTLWPIIEPWLKKGMEAATDLTLASVRDDLRRGEADLWAIVEPGKVRGAFLTSLYEHEHGGGYVGVYGLGGEDLDAWAKHLGSIMKQFAKSQGAKSVRFHGREAWSRVLPDFSVIGERQGHQLYEGAI